MRGAGWREGRQPAACPGLPCSLPLCRPCPEQRLRQQSPGAATGGGASLYRGFPSPTATPLPRRRIVALRRDSGHRVQLRLRSEKMLAGLHTGMRVEATGIWVAGHALDMGAARSQGEPPVLRADAIRDVSPPWEPPAGERAAAGHATRPCRLPAAPAVPRRLPGAASKPTRSGATPPERHARPPASQRNRSPSTACAAACLSRPAALSAPPCSRRDAIRGTPAEEWEQELLGQGHRRLLAPSSP